MAYDISNGNVLAAIPEAPLAGPMKDSMFGVVLVLSIPAIPILLALVTSLVGG